MPKRVVPVRVRPWALHSGDAALCGMGLAKSPRLRGRRGCSIAYGIGHAGSLIIAIRLEIEGNGRQACSLAGRVVEAPRVDFPARHSMLAVIFESPTIRWPKKSFATW